MEELPFDPVLRMFLISSLSFFLPLASSSLGEEWDLVALNLFHLLEVHDRLLFRSLDFLYFVSDFLDGLQP